MLELRKCTAFLKNFPVNNLAHQSAGPSPREILNPRGAAGAFDALKLYRRK
jgi:hypothetical protein